MWTLTGDDKVRVQSSELAAPEIQNYAFAQSMLRKKNKKVKVNVDYDLGNDGSSELFALYPNGTLEIYTYDMKMSGYFMKDVKPTAKIKGVKEVRVKNVKKGLVAIKTKKGKIVVYKYTFVKAKKKGSISKKAFKKLKKKVTFEKLRGGIDSIYSETTMLYAAENFYIDEHYHDEEKFTSKYIARYDKEDKENPYKLFFERHSDDGDFNTSGRVILGPDEAADWKADVQKYDTIKNAVPILGYAYAGKDVKVTEELKTLKGTILLFAAQNGSAVKINAGDINLQVMPKAPEFDPYIFFIGATDGWAASDQKLYSPNGDGIYTGYCYVADPNNWGLAFKFQKVAGSWDDQINAGTFETKEGVSGTDNIEVAEAGVYYFEIDLVKKSIKATKIDYMGVTGGFTGWNEGSQMTWNPTDYCFELTTATPIEGEWKFRANGLTDNDWKINLGGDKDDLTLGGGNLTISGKTIKLYPTRKTSDKIYCTVE
jgi:hypothetical protein